MTSIILQKLNASIALFSASAAVLGVALTAMDSTVYQNNLKKRTSESQLKLQATRVISREYPSLYKMYMTDSGMELSMHNTDKLHYASGGWGSKRTDQSFNSFLDEFIKSSVEMSFLNALKLN
jgi:hypothetical protein